MIDLTFDEAVSLIQRAIDEKGADYVYGKDERSMRGKCQYFNGDKPSCIVGYVLFYKGVTRDDLSFWANENRSAKSLCADVPPMYRDEETQMIKTDEQTAEFLNWVQDYQDNGVSWGEAFAYALASVKPE